MSNNNRHMSSAWKTLASRGPTLCQQRRPLYMRNWESSMQSNVVTSSRRTNVPRVDSNFLSLCPSLALCAANLMDGRHDVESAPAKSRANLGSHIVIRSDTQILKNMLREEHEEDLYFPTIKRNIFYTDSEPNHFTASNAIE